MLSEKNNTPSFVLKFLYVVFLQSISEKRFKITIFIGNVYFAI